MKKTLEALALSFLITLTVFALVLALIISPILWGWTGFLIALFVVMWAILWCVLI